MRVDLWDRNADVGQLPPDLTVFTLELIADPFFDFDDRPFKPQMSDVAWTARNETERHFWMRDWRGKVRVISMPLADYIRRHEAEITGMNPFWSLGRMEFMARWKDAHGQAVS